MHKKAYKFINMTQVNSCMYDKQVIHTAVDFAVGQLKSQFAVKKEKKKT